MPFYFFDVDDGRGLVSATEPMEFRTDGAAREDAARALAEMARDRSDGAQVFLAVHVRRQSGEVIGVATLVIDVRPQDSASLADQFTRRRKLSR